MKSILILSLLGSLLTQAAPTATAARLWLRVPADSPPLGSVTSTSGTVSNGSWLDDKRQRERLSDITFPIRWWSWLDNQITFTPAADGPVEIFLNGPWVPGPDGKIARLEVLWDDFSVRGAELTNPGFEDVADSTFAGWVYSYGIPLSATEWPLATAMARTGKKAAASWHDRPLAQIIHVKAGQPVTLIVHAKSAAPADFIEPRRLGKHTIAHREIKKIKRGINLGNCWEAAPPYTWGIRFTPGDIDRIAAEGFDHIRVPIGWHFFLKENNGTLEISQNLLQDLEPVLKRALEKNLHVLIDWHHFHDLTADPDAHSRRFVEGWKVIANHFKTWPDALWLELLNEPRDALTTARVNELHAETLKEIRKIDAERLIFLSPGNWGAISELEAIRLPDDDERLIVTVHNYDPHFFTHQGAGWDGLTEFTGVRFPGPPVMPLTLPASLHNRNDVKSFVEAYNSLPADQDPSSSHQLARLLNMARQWSDEFGRPIHLGEFGAIDVADRDSRNRYVREVRDLAESHAIPWTLWDWKARFAYWDSETGQPLLREAVFGR